jgi:hypothetical protein
MKIHWRRFVLAALCVSFAGCSVPSRKDSVEEPSSALPGDAFRVDWISVEPVSKLEAGGAATFAVTLRNSGSATWPDPQAAQPEHPRGMFAVRLSWRWLDLRDHRVLGDFRPRSDLPWPVAPGTSVILPCAVQIPAAAGNYELEFQLVQEGVDWFSSKGADRLILPISVAKR